MRFFSGGLIMCWAMALFLHIQLPVIPMPSKLGVAYGASKLVDGDLLGGQNGGGGHGWDKSKGGNSAVGVSEDVTGQSQSAACLYVMDDNHYLIEWLAYHYHTINLRHVIITSDPQSRTSPVEVTNRWKHLMDIQLWDDEDFLPYNFQSLLKERMDTKKDVSTDPETLIVLEHHRARQASFNLKCLEHHKKAGRGWTLMVDVDEYMTYNPDLEETPELSSANDAWTREWKILPVEEPGSLMRILEQIMIPDPDFEAVESPCVPVYRVQFSALESKDIHVDNMVPSGFDGHDFQTLRWRRYGSRKIEHDTASGLKCEASRSVPIKVAIDLSRIRFNDLRHPENRGNPHVPLGSICSDDIYMKRGKTPLMAHHYMGSLEQWLFREGDKRGQGYRLARYADLNNIIGKRASDQVRPWLLGFVSAMGRKEASRLLKGVGILDTGLAPTSVPELSTENSKYKVGDIVQANFAGEGEWVWAEIYSVLPNGYYNLFFPEDCSQEIATFEDRLRASGEVDDTEGLSMRQVAMIEAKFAEQTLRKKKKLKKKKKRAI